MGGRVSFSQALDGLGEGENDSTGGRQESGDAHALHCNWGKQSGETGITIVVQLAPLSVRLDDVLLRYGLVLGTQIVTVWQNESAVVKAETQEAIATAEAARRAMAAAYAQAMAAEDEGSSPQTSASKSKAGIGGGRACTPAHTPIVTSPVSSSSTPWHSCPCSPDPQVNIEP